MEENKHHSLQSNGNHTNEHFTRGQITGGVINIFLAGAAVTLPLVALSVALVVIVWTKQVPKNPPSTLFTIPSQDDQSVFFVNISAPTFLTIASWSSSVVQAVTGFAIVLVSFPVARTIKKSSRTYQTHELPTPFQLSLILGLLQGGGFGAVWNWMKYQFGWQGRREKITSPLKSSILVTLAVLFLGICILVADTWLHITTTTIEYVQIKSDGSSPPLFSMELPAACYNTNQSWATDCILSPGASAVFLIGAGEAQQTLSNVSAEHSVTTVFGSSAPSVFLGPAKLPDLATNLDFEASTIAISTECVPVSQECNLNAAFGASTPFNCYSGSFQGDLAHQSWYMEFFADSSRSSNETSQSSNNPFYWNAANIDPDSTNEVLKADPEIITPVHGGISWVMECTSTALLTTYSFSNGTLDHYETNQANNSIADLLMAPLAYTTIGALTIRQAAISAGLAADAQGVADLLAVSYSQIAMSAVAGVMQAQPVNQFQSRQLQLVARIPKAPLFTLLGSNLAFALVGIILVIVAFGSMAGNLGKDLTDVQARLSNAGIVSAAFESEKGGVKKVEDLFDERNGDGRRRIGMVDSPAGWKFELWNVGV